MSVEAVDTGGNSTRTTRTIRVDNHAPTRPTAIGVNGGEGWRQANDFRVGWRNPDGQAAPIVRARYSMCPAVGSGSCRTGSQDGDDIGRLDDLTAPRTGDHVLRVWLEDAAGNTSQQHASDPVHLRFDNIAPRGFFEPQRSDDPRRVVVAASDDASGLAGGNVEIRAKGSRTWRELDTSRRANRLVANVNDEELRDGRYELRARMVDRAGNDGTTTRRKNGRAMVLTLPLRTKTRIEAGFVTRATRRVSRRRRGRKRRRQVGHRSERTTPSTRVRYGGRARLVGMLRTETGRPLGRAPIELLARRAGESGYRPFARTTTDSGGLFNFALPPGPSRHLRVRYVGTPTILPATAQARLAVRGKATLRLSPRRLNRGDVLTFTGRVRAAGATIPSRGKLVQVQFRDGRRWRPAVRLARTDSHGRFRITYRFRRISSPTRISFRILVPAEETWGYETGTSPRRSVDVYP